MQLDARRRFYRDEASEGSFLSPVYSQFILRGLYSHLRNQSPQEICDLASGRGGNLPTLREMFASSSILAVDLNHSALRAGRETTPSSLPVEADLEALPFPDSRIDLAVCTEALEHVADLDQALSEIARIVRPHGHAVISSPNYLNPMGLRKWWHDRLRGTEHWDPWGGHPGFERLMLPASTTRTIERYFKVLLVRGGGYLMAWFPLGYRRIGRLHDRFPLLRMGKWPLLRNLAMNRYLLLQRKQE